MAVRLAVSRARRWAWVWMSGCLAACASQPLPPWTLPGSAAAAPPPAVRAAPRPAPALPGTAALPAPVAAPAVETSSLEAPNWESPAVAARFPDPAVEFHTPAFQPGHSGFTSNVELQGFIHALARETPAPTSIKLLSLGQSQSGLPLEGLLFTRSPDTDPAALANGPRATVLLVGQQHGDEPAGSEALLVIADELAHGRLQELLDRVNVIVVPRANPDGAAAHRRVTASGIDMNRDHLLLKTPEAQALAKLMNDYKPAVVVDAHEYTAGGRFVEKYGAVQRFDALLQYAMTANLPEFITKASEEWFRQPIVSALKARSLTVDWYYTTSTDAADKKLSMGGVQPDTLRNVDGLRNAVSLLVETRGVGLGREHFKRRVYTQVVAAQTALRSAAERGADLLKLERYVDNAVSADACHGDAIIDARPTSSEYTLVMLDPQTGADKPLTVSWDSALELHPLTQRARPCGYWLSADQTDAVMHLRALGVVVQQLEELGEMRAEFYQETGRELSERSDVRGSIADSGGVLQVKVQTNPALLDAQAGSFYVGLDQPLANLAIAALEPDSQNSLVAHRIVPNVAAEARVMLAPNVKMSPVP